MAKTETKAVRFEDGLKRLEQIVDDLEKGDLPLEKSIELFEEGKKLSDFCKKKLDEAQFKVEMLMKNGKGESKAVPFEENGAPSAAIPGAPGTTSRPGVAPAEKPARGATPGAHDDSVRRPRSGAEGGEAKGEDDIPF